MKGPADVYRAEILRAVMGDHANVCKVANIERLNQIAAHLVDCEDAKAILRAKGYGAAGMTFVELAKSLPENVRGILREIFKSRKLSAQPSIAWRDQ
jgi:fructose 1,6-bisphosphatase